LQAVPGIARESGIRAWLPREGLQAVYDSKLAGPELTRRVRAKSIGRSGKHFAARERVSKKSRDRTWCTVANKFVRAEAVNLLTAQTQTPICRNHLGAGRRRRLSVATEMVRTVDSDHYSL
jgi:hypothetical protein